MLTENNIEILKQIQKLLIASNEEGLRAVNISFLKDKYIVEKTEIEYNELNTEFRKIAQTFKDFEIGKITENKYLGDITLNLTHNIYNFDFDKKYNEQKVNTHLTALKNIKIENDAKLSKWQVKTFWTIFFIAFLGIGISVNNVIINQKKTKEIKLLESKTKQITTELQKLHTLILNRKIVDSALIPKTDLNQKSK